MNVENIQTDKLDLINWISQLQDSTLIKELKKIKLSRTITRSDELTKEQKIRIELSRNQLRNGEGVSNEDAQIRIKKYIQSKKTA